MADRRVSLARPAAVATLSSRVFHACAPLWQKLVTPAAIDGLFWPAMVAALPMSFLAPHRSDCPGDDPIFSLHLEASGRKARGEDVINATVGALLDDEGKLAVMSVVPEVLGALKPEIGAAYPPIVGFREYRQAVIDSLLPNRDTAEMAIAVATPGGSGALHHAISNFVEPHQTVLTTSQYWGPYKTLCDALARKLHTFRMFNEERRFDTADFEQKLAHILDVQGRALVLLNTPCHNPTGYSLDEEELLATASILKNLSRKGPISVVLDVAYERYGTQPLDQTRDILLNTVGDILLLFAWSASKSFTQYGLRTGALVAVHPEEKIRRSVEAALGFTCRGTWSTCNAAGMAAITRVLTDPELRMRADRERDAFKSLLLARAQTWQRLSQELSLDCPRWEGGFFSTVMHEQPSALAAKLREEGLYVVPVHGGLRIALCSVSERALPRLASAIAKHQSAR